MKKLLLFLSLVSLRLLGATGDIIAANIPADGYSIAITFSGMATNGTTDLGLGTYKQAIENAKLRLAVTSQALTVSNTTTTMNERIIGQQTMRYPYPGQALIDSSLSGSDTVVRFALSDYIFTGDTITLSASAGLYIAGGVTNAATNSFSVVNNSTVPHFKPTGNWTIVGRDIITNTTVTLKAFAMSRDARGGQPVKAMIFRLSDGTTTLTNTETVCKIDRNAGDMRVVCEYMSTFTVSNLTHGATLTGNFTAIPFRGTNYLDTADGVNSELAATTRYAPIRLVNDYKFQTDITNSYGRSVAVVDPAGNNATAKVQRYYEWLASPTTNYYADFKAAANAIVASNNTAGFLATTRNDHGAAFIFARAGNYAYSGSGTAPTGNMPETYLTIAADPSTTRTNVILDGVSGNTQMKKLIKLDSFTIGKTNASFVFGADMRVWWNNCILNQSSNNWGSSLTNLSITKCYITNFPALTPTGGPQTIGLFRGNRMDRWPGIITGTTIIGNVRYYTNSTSGPIIANDRTGTNEDSTNHIIIAFNSFYGGNQTLSDAITLWNNVDNNVTGALIVQNEVEMTGDGVSCWMTMANGTAGTFKNVIEAYNTGLGKTISKYNDTGSTGPFWQGCIRVKCIHLNDNLKSDTFTTGNAGRTNNWSAMLGIGYSGNWFAEIDPVGAAASFRHDSVGLMGFQNASPTTNSVMQFIRAGYFYGGIRGSDARGDYRFHSTAQAQKLAGGRPGFWGLPYDLYGNPRTAYDPPGAVTGGSIKQASSFAE